MCDTGYSDSVASALALEMANREKKKDAPLLLFSCCFAYSSRAQGLKNLILERVGNNRESLKNKWNAACTVGAFALVLHEDDANILAEDLHCNVKNLTSDIFRKKSSETPYIISCRSNQWKLLKKAVLKKKSQYILPIFYGIFSFLFLFSCFFLSKQYGKKMYNFEYFIKEKRKKYHCWTRIIL